MPCERSVLRCTTNGLQTAQQVAPADCDSDVAAGAAVAAAAPADAAAFPIAALLPVIRKWRCTLIGLDRDRI